MILDMAMGGSTNTVLHILAIAHEAGVPFSLERIDELSKKTPNICKVSPSSQYHIEDVARAGGIHTILGEVARGCPGLLDLSCHDRHRQDAGREHRRNTTSAMRASSATARLLTEVRAGGERTSQAWTVPSVGRAALAGRRAGRARRRRRRPDRRSPRRPATARGQRAGRDDGFDPFDVIRTVDNAYSRTGGLTMLYGNLAPKGAVVKTAGVSPKMLKHIRPGRDLRERDRRLQRHRLRQGQGGRRGGDPLRRAQGRARACRRCSPPPRRSRASGWTTSCALITDGRFSGGTAGASIGHVSPEAAVGGPIGLLEGRRHHRDRHPHRRALGPALRRGAGRPPRGLDARPAADHVGLPGPLRQDGHQRRHRRDPQVGRVRNYPRRLANGMNSVLRFGSLRDRAVGNGLGQQELDTRHSERRDTIVRKNDDSRDSIVNINDDFSLCSRRQFIEANDWCSSRVVSLCQRTYMAGSMPPGSTSENLNRKPLTSSGWSRSKLR